MDVQKAAFNYVPYPGDAGRLKPFASGRLESPRFVGEFAAQNRFTGNFGGGVDIGLKQRRRIRPEFRDFPS